MPIQATQSFFNRWGILGIVFGVLLLIVVPFMIGEMFTNLDAHEIMVVQSPISGTLDCYTTAGLKVTSFGRVTRYPRRAEYDFFLIKDGKDKDGRDIIKSDNTKKIQFGDGGHASLDGGVNWEMPLDCKSIIEIHKTFGSADGVGGQISKAIDSAIYLSGPMMTSTEASGERKAELIELINDQARNGIYQTSSHREEQPDPITGEKKLVTVMEIARDASGQVKRQQGSLLAQFNVRLLPISLRDMIYEDIVTKQIARRQEAATEVQIAQANARRAEQNAITIAKEGEANAAKAKWEQETIKAKFVTEAQQKLEVATLAAREADQYRQEQILRGTGDAERKKLVMAADGALDQKLQAYVQVQKSWAEAFSKYAGNVVPTTVLGGNGQSASGNGAQQFMDLITAKTAHDLSLDLSNKGQAAKQ